MGSIVDDDLGHNPYLSGVPGNSWSVQILRPRSPMYLPASPAVSGPAPERPMADPFPLTGLEFRTAVLHGDPTLDERAG